MSDALLERLAVATEGILAHIKKSPVFGLPTGGAATPPKPVASRPAATAPKADAKDANAIAADTTKTPAQKAEEANKAIAARKAAKEVADKAAKAAAAKGPAAGTKAPGGKHTIDQVRLIIRKVANEVDMPSAKNILLDDGGGVEKVGDLKPENYDAVYEACEVLLNGEGSKGAAAAAEPEDDLM